MKTKTTEQFIEDARKIHKDRYDYTKTSYVNSKMPVCIICPKHGEFWQTPSTHLKGSGCAKCAHKYVNQLKVITSEEFIRRANLSHNNFYDYSKTIYSGFNSDVIVICPIHGEFTINAHTHVSNKQGCPKCGQMRRITSKLSNTEAFIKKAKTVHNNFYDYSKVQYVNAKTPVCIICPKHGEFWQTPNKHLNGHKCLRCRQSKGEMLVERILLQLQIPFDKEVRYKSEKFERTFRIDFVVKIKDQVFFIEYNGMQHYYISEQFGGKIVFDKQKLRDKQLRIFCKNNNYKLLEIKYNLDEDTIFEKIKNFLNVPVTM